MKQKIVKSSKWIAHFIAIVFFLFAATTSHLYSQSLIEKIGGVSTSFEFSSDSVDLPIIDQAIIQRGYFDFSFDRDKSVINSYASAYGYGYGLQTFHLEFITTSDIKQIVAYDTKPVQAKYNIKLYDDKNTMILEFEVLYQESKATPKLSGMTSYSINLYRIPMILFNKTKKIDITIILM
jgi:hypothetical protein